MEAMKLEDFVLETLRQIIGGVKAAQEATKDSGAVICQSYGVSAECAAKANRIMSSGGFVEHVGFDVAVSISEGAGSQGGLGIFISGFGVGGKKTSQESSVSNQRITFSVPVRFPAG